MKHALVIGGTGMLSKVSLWLIENGYHVSVIARNAERMKKLIQEAGSDGRVTPLFVDYRDSDDLKKNIHQTIKQNGNINIVVAWIHSIAENALQIIVNEVTKGNTDWELFHILGSRANLEEIKKKAVVPINCKYYQVQLGFKMEGTRSRWLTNEEISEGIIEAIKKKKNMFMIGQMEPWEKRPD
ncbi:short-chain dehydrogenase [Neobacillus thermocopriae]|uniref:short-chain dehydrogenase n=1 Tax=Neobacillus thermocopriae TaxID=1215031 RepID=UPI002E1AE194|nr:short-chain dehydrogenase [Neobacillus thermocopriae]MED3714501.1 short-chain dehydrogenase [Neobacillus thermocopriae]